MLKVDDTRLYEYCYIMIVTALLEQRCNNCDNIKQGCYKLLTACSKLAVNLKQAVRAQLVDGLFADLPPLIYITG